MPPLHRGRGVSTVTPYSRQNASPTPMPWTSTRPFHGDCRQVQELDLPDDALAAVFARCHHVADVVRCAATCKRWARVVAESSAIISHALPPLGLFLPSRIALGIFHQQKDTPTARTRRPMCFVPAASAARLLPAQRSSSMHSRPVASRNGLLVLELQPECRGQGHRLLVCNPMTGREVMLPPLPGSEKLRDYSCAVLTGKDCQKSHTYLRVLLLYTRRGVAAVRCYSSDTRHWGAEAISDVEIKFSWKLRLAQADAIHGGMSSDMRWM